VEDLAADAADADATDLAAREFLSNLAADTSSPTHGRRHLAAEKFLSDAADLDADSSPPRNVSPTSTPTSTPTPHHQELRYLKCFSTHCKCLL
jgi:hypothetical protein